MSKLNKRKILAFGAITTVLLLLLPAISTPVVATQQDKEISSFLPKKLRIKVSRLVTENSLTVTITDRTGKPVPFATVKIERIKLLNFKTDLLEKISEILRTRHTNLKGKASFILLTPGIYKITASANLREYKPGKVFIIKLGGIGKKSGGLLSGLLNPKLKIEVPRIITKGLFTVTVTDQSGKPVPGAQVEIEKIKLLGKNKLVRFKLTGLFGKARFMFLKPGLYKITASATLRGYGVKSVRTIRL
jgi:hypothetical protein